MVLIFLLFILLLEKTQQYIGYLPCQNTTYSWIMIIISLLFYIYIIFSLPIKTNKMIFDPNLRLRFKIMMIFYNNMTNIL